jgi:hypothetical protein
LPVTEPVPLMGVRPAGRDPVDAASACAASLTKLLVAASEAMVPVPTEVVVALERAVVPALPDVGLSSG